MNHETMSVHEGMAAIKMLDKRLDALAQGTYFSAATVIPSAAEAERSTVCPRKRS